MKSFADYISPKNHLIRHVNDGTPSGQGDCLHREGLFWFVFILSKFYGLTQEIDWLQYPRALKFPDVVQKLWSKDDGMFMRAPGAPYNTPFDGEFSVGREQLRPFMFPLALTQSAGPFLQVAAVLRKFGWWPNGIKRFGDWYTFEDRMLVHYMGEICDCAPDTSRIVLYLGYVQLLLSSIVRVIASHIRHDDVGPCLMHIQALYFMHRFFRDKSRLVRLSIWTYVNFRYKGPQYAFDKYFENDSAPPMNEIYRPICEELETWRGWTKLVRMGT